MKEKVKKDFIAWVKSMNPKWTAFPIDERCPYYGEEIFTDLSMSIGLDMSIADPNRVPYISGYLIFWKDNSVDKGGITLDWDIHSSPDPQVGCTWLSCDETDDSFRGLELERAWEKFMNKLDLFPLFVQTCEFYGSRGPVREYSEMYPLFEAWRRMGFSFMSE